MSSVIDSFREIYSDNFSFLKILVLAIPVYFCDQLYTMNKQNIEASFWLWSITLFFLFGFLIKVTNNVINERDHILPSLNPIKLSASSIKGIVAIFPISFIGYKLAFFLCSLVNIVGWFNIAMHSVIWLIVASAILNSFLIFTEKERIKDAFNLKIFLNNTGDLFVIIIFFVLQLFFINFFTTIFISYLLFILFGEGLIFNSFISYVIVFNIAAIGHCLGQIHYEILGSGNNPSS